MKIILPPTLLSVNLLIATIAWGIRITENIYPINDKKELQTIVDKKLEKKFWDERDWDGGIISGKKCILTANEMSLNS